jgi:hypothetical protein
LFDRARVLARLLSLAGGMPLNRPGGTEGDP